MLRARLLIAGHTMTSFAAQHGLSRDTVKAAVHGKRRSGKKTLLVLRKIAETIGGKRRVA